jgi:divalent metal cation (Fe/Co/Zn/Cd) transporter
VASIAIGLLLAAVAVTLGADTKSLLLGEAALPKDRARIEYILQSHPAVDSIRQILTMAIGPNSLVVAARVHLDESLRSPEIEQVAFELDQQLREAIPVVSEFFLDPTSRTEPDPPDMSRAEQAEREAESTSDAVHVPAREGEAGIAGSED